MNFDPNRWHCSTEKIVKYSVQCKKKQKKRKKGERTLFHGNTVKTESPVDLRAKKSQKPKAETSAQQWFCLVTKIFKQLIKNTRNWSNAPWFLRRSLCNFTAVSHGVVRSTRGQKMRSLVVVPVFQVVQHVQSLQALCRAFSHSVSQQVDSAKDMVSPVTWSLACAGGGKERAVQTFVGSSGWAHPTSAPWTRSAAPTPDKSYSSWRSGHTLSFASLEGPPFHWRSLSVSSV